MIESLPAWFRELHPVAQALCAGIFTWGVTALGAALVLFTRRMDQRLLDAAQGFAAGVMMAASVWSLLLPAIELAGERGDPPWLPATIGLLLGAAFLRLADATLPHLHLGQPASAAEGPPTTWRRTTLLVLAITLHNIPEGLAVGVAFGASSALGAAVALALGIGLQNLPEGLAVAMPLRREGLSRGRSFWYGQLSAIVEPIAAVLGAAATLLVRPILPYTLAFAAGAMLYVVVEELIPESQGSGNTDLATLGTIGGFAVMMVLDVALG
ncbi:MAG: ZIP family metal transporter [Thermomicrobiales bacterium]